MDKPIEPKISRTRPEPTYTSDTLIGVFKYYDNELIDLVRAVEKFGCPLEEVSMYVDSNEDSSEADQYVLYHSTKVADPNYAANLASYNTMMSIYEVNYANYLEKLDAWNSHQEQKIVERERAELKRLLAKYEQDN